MATSKANATASPSPTHHPLWRVLFAIGWVVALLAGIAALSAPVNDLMNPNAADYRLLRTIHAGNTLASITSKLGEPDDSDEESRAGLTANTYIRDEFAALIVVSSFGEVVLYSVIACDPSFAPTFDLPSGNKVKLNSATLEEASAALGPPGATQEEILGLVNLSYAHSPEGDNANQLVEYARSTGRFSLQQYIGVSGACSPTNFGGESMEDPTVFQGRLESAPPEVIAFRSTVRANLYTEALDRFELDDRGRLAMDLRGDDGIFDTSLDTLVAPDEDDLGGAFGQQWRK